MDGLNKVMLLGNLGADPELRMTPGGQAVLNIRMACTESYLDKNKQKQERTEWASVKVWGKRAEGLAKILSKGDRIFIEGRMETSNYEDKNGEKRYRTDIVANNIVLCGGKGEGRPAATQNSSRGRGAPTANPAGDFGEDYDPFGSR